MDFLDIGLASIGFLTLHEKFLLKKNIDTLEQLAVLSIEDISRIVGRNIRRAIWDGRETAVQVQKSATLMEKQRICAIRYGSEAYPALLKEIPDAPYMFFYRGDMQVLAKNCVSVVGTRNICQECAQATLAFTKSAAMDGLTVVSGNANGIDAFAHRGALSSGVSGSTAAILPCGIDTIVPVGHKVLVQKILEAGGLLASEYIPGCPAEAWRFVQRNRIIAALSAATVVMQAPPGSGALITASFALDYNRELLFHQSGFCKAALRINEDTVAKLKLRKGGEKKLKIDSGHYLEAGAPLISDYAEFKAACADAPGTHTYSKIRTLRVRGREEQNG